MEKRDRIQRLWELHMEGVREILKVYTAEEEDEGEASFEDGLIAFESSLGHELHAANNSVYAISEALREISEDLARECFTSKSSRTLKTPSIRDSYLRNIGSSWKDFFSTMSA